MAESGVQKLAGVTISPGSVAMALWSGLGNAATVAQLVGKGDAGGLIAMIIRAAATARQNRRECEQLARRVLMIAELLPHLEHLPEAAARSLAGLDETLREAHELVGSCQGRSVAYQFVLARRQADKFRELHGRIDSYLIVFPVVSYIGITRRLDQICSILVPGHTPCPPSSPPLPRPRPQLQDIDPDGVGAEEFTLAELATVTSNFAPEAKIGEGGSGMVYRARLRHGREVAVKRFTRNAYRDHEDAFRTELAILPTLRHEHIIPLLGGCSEEEHLLVYEYMSNGSLHDHLHKQPAPLTSCSPVTMSWRARVEVLLGVSRAVEHLHGHAAPIIHRDIKPSNILLDASWVPCLADFGLSLAWDPREAARVHPVVGTYGYADTEYLCTGRLSPASDVYNFGMVMLEVLTGMTADSQVVNRAGERWVPEDSVSFALRFIEAGELEEVLDRRPSAEPASQQLKALELVAHTAARCVRLRGTDRPPIQDVVASLQAALDIISQDECMPWHGLYKWV